MNNKIKLAATTIFTFTTVFTITLWWLTKQKNPQTKPQKPNYPHPIRQRP